MYRSMLSHSVLPVDIRYRMCPCPVSLYPSVQCVCGGGLTRSVTFLFRSNSARAKARVSARVLRSGMRCVERTMVR